MLHENGAPVFIHFRLSPSIPQAGGQKMLLSLSQMDFFILASLIILFHFCLAQQTCEEDSEGDAY